jgi:hypothetical protein
VDAELREQALGTVVVHHQLRGRLHLERGRQQAIRQQLGKGVRHADGQPHGLAGGAAAQRFGQLAPQPEDLVRVLLRGAAGLRERQPAAGTDEQGLAQLLLQLLQLRADGRLGDVQHLGGARDAPLARHGPEVLQVTVVERGHGRTGNGWRRGGAPIHQRKRWIRERLCIRARLSKV